MIQLRLFRGLQTQLTIVGSWLAVQGPLSLPEAYGQGYPSRAELKSTLEQTFGEPKNTTKLSKEGRVWIDAKRNLLIVDGYVTLREGQLEMFACPVGTKEHESIVAVFSSARDIHAGLLAIGAQQGKPTQFDPYQPASGSTIKIYVLWRDAEKNKHTELAQTWIREAAGNQEMRYEWVFAGSILHKDTESGEETYLGDSGDLICVANFPTATLDLAIQSISDNSSLAFAAFTERIPPQFTVVRLVLEPSDDPPKHISTANAPTIAPFRIQEEKKKPEMTDIFSSEELEELLIPSLRPGQPATSKN